MLSVGVQKILAEAGDMVVAGEGATIADAVQQVSGAPDLMLLDPNAVNHLAGAMEPLVPAWPELPVLLFYTELSATMGKLCDAGLVRGSVSAASTPMQLLAAIRLVAGGGQYWDPKSIRGLAPKQSRRRLSPRQLEVLRLACTGLTDRDIATTLGLSVHTVVNQMAHLRTIFGVHNRTSLLFASLRGGILGGLGSAEPNRDPFGFTETLPRKRSKAHAAGERATSFAEEVGGGEALSAAGAVPGGNGH